MHFMIGRIFMNQESKVINVHLEKRENKDYLLQFLEKPEYKTGLYIDVCKEYIKDLNKEITNVRKNMPEKLKIQ